MLFQVGLLVAVLFSAAAIINGFSIYRSSSDGYLEMLEKHTGEMLTQVRATVEEYRALPWLLDYWQVNHAALDLPGGREERAARVARAAGPRYCRPEGGDGGAGGEPSRAAAPGVRGGVLPCADAAVLCLQSQL